MPKKAIHTKKASTKKLAPAPAPEASKNEAPLIVRFAVLEDVVRRSVQDTRAFGAKLDTFSASQTELARRVAAVEKRGQ